MGVGEVKGFKESRMGDRGGRRLGAHGICRTLFRDVDSHASIRNAWNTQGQMSVELAVVMPVVLVVAVIAVNALTFFSECAQFDRVCRNAVRVCATAPAYGQDLAASAALVETMVEEAMNLSNTESAVEVSENALGYATFVVTLSYRPTLFGMGLKSRVFGVSLPALNHSISLAVDPYNPGMLL